MYWCAIPTQCRFLAGGQIRSAGLRNFMAPRPGRDVRLTMSSHHLLTIITAAGCFVTGKSRIRPPSVRSSPAQVQTGYAPVQCHNEQSGQFKLIFTT